MMNIQARDRYLADFKSIEAVLPGERLPWLRRARRTAAERKAATGFPTVRDENWKYTNLVMLENRTFTPSTHAVGDLTATQVAELVFAGLACHLLVFVDGHYAPALSRLGKLADGIIVASIAELLVHKPDLLEPILSRGGEANAFAALNAAFVTDGAYIHLPAGSVVEQTIHLLFVSTVENQAIHTHNVIFADERAQASVIEHYASLNNSAYFTNATTSITLGAHASIEHYKLQQESTKAFHIAGIHALQNRDSRFTSHSLALGGLLARNDIIARLDAEGCECNLNGLYIVDGRQHVDHHTCIDHAKPRCTSREYYRGVLNGASRAVFNGKVIVHQDAQKTDAQQANHNLLLSGEAEIDTKPELQIYADDVKCAHGATIGRIDEDMMFYLRSRGISNDMAHGLLTYAFAHDIVDRIGLKPLRQRLERILMSQLPQGEQIKELV